MPRHFSPEERVEIEQKLLEAGEKLFKKYGVTKTTIGDITEEAGVGKGTFYNFFGAKGDLFAAIYTREWLKVNELMENKYLNKKGSLPELALSYIEDNRKNLLEHPLLSIVYERTTLSYISDKAAHENLMAFRDLSSQKLENIIDSWIKANNLTVHVDVRIIAGMMRSLSVLNYHKDEAGEDIFDEIIQHLSQAIALLIAEKS